MIELACMDPFDDCDSEDGDVRVYECLEALRFGDGAYQPIEDGMGNCLVFDCTSDNYVTVSCEEVLTQEDYDMVKYLNFIHCVFVEGRCEEFVPEELTGFCPPPRTGPA
ncbi:MAG: hypothetical protein HKN10_04930 [Myxococcales bacterium]|nr:hypothetical protein [Myxococcales bacterium]